MATDPFIHYIAADRVDAPADGDAGAGAFGQPTAADIKAINARCALTPQEADALFVWSFEISNNRVDSHGTWMDATSLRNYARQANGDRGVPYLRHHDVYTDEMGRVFRGDLIEGGDMPAMPKGALPLARDVFGRGDRTLRRLVETAYTRRDLDGAPDLIARLESGISASNSIGFGVYTPASPGGMLRCDICDVDLYERVDGRLVCPHAPGWETEVEIGRGEERQTVAVIATAAVINATQREASGVYLGSTPATFTLADRAAALYADGRLDEKTARGFEDMHRLLRGTVTGRTHAIIDMGRGATVPSAEEPPSAGQTGAREPIGDRAMDDMTARTLIGGDADLLAAYELEDRADPGAALHRAHVAVAASARKDAADARAATEALRSTLAARIGQADGESLAAALDRVMAHAELGRGARDRLIDEMLAQMTRAGLPYTADTQRAIAERMTIAEIEAQTAMYKSTADQAFTPGRVSDPDVASRRASAAAPRPNPALVS